MRVQSLGREDPLEKEMTTHSSVLAWRILWTEEAGGLQSIGLQRVREDLAQQEQQIKTLEERITSLLLHFFFLIQSKLQSCYICKGCRNAFPLLYEEWQSHIIKVTKTHSYYVGINFWPLINLLHAVFNWHLCYPVSVLFQILLFF